MAPSTPTQPKPRLIFLLNTAQRRLQQWIAAEQQAIGPALPTPAQAGLLFVLARSDGCTMGEIARTLGLAPSAATGLVQRVAALGWLAQRADPQDARSQRVWLRPAGRAQLPRLQAPLTRIQARLTQGFSEAEIAIVARWLDHVRQLGEVEGRDGR